MVLSKLPSLVISKEEALLKLEEKLANGKKLLEEFKLMSDEDWLARKWFQEIIAWSNTTNQLLLQIDSTSELSKQYMAVQVNFPRNNATIYKVTEALQPKFFTLNSIICQICELMQPKNQLISNDLSNVLNRFRPCLKYKQSADIASEADLQRLTFEILRSHFDDLVDQESLPKFGTKSHKPDFGVPSLHVLIELKYLASGTNIKTIQDEMQSDIIGYLDSQENYTQIIFLVYDASHRIRDKQELSVLKKNRKVLDVVIVDGI